MSCVCLVKLNNKKKDLFLFASYVLISPCIKSISFKLHLLKSMRAKLNKVEMRRELFFLKLEWIVSTKG